MDAKSKCEIRIARHKRIRKKVAGTVDRPRMCVFRSNRYIYVQLIDDVTGHVMVSASSFEKELAQEFSNAKSIAAAQKVGERIAVRAVEKSISNVVFDRGGYRYHGKIKALAESARAAGLIF